MPVDDDVLLASQDERDAMLAELAALVAGGGYEHLVLAPLIGAEPTYFPDHWAGGSASVVRMLRRLFVYADLESLRARAVIEPDIGLGPMSPAGVGAPAWFDKFEGDKVTGKTALVGVRESSLRDPAQLASALARVTAEVWRAHHGLAVVDNIREQRGVDVAAIYLGFGRLTVGSALRHGIERSGARPRANTTRLGVLPPRTLAFVLAAQIHVRELDADARRQLGRELGGNTQAFFETALAWHDRNQAGLHELLRIPPRADWSAPPSLSLLTAPLTDDEDAGDESAAESRHDGDRGVLGMNVGRPVFRVERSKARRLARMLGLPVLLLGMLAGRMQMGVEFEMWKALTIAGALALAGLAIGRMFPDVRCSEPRCGEPLKPGAATCPRCGGQIVGAITHPKERLAAEEEYASKSAGARDAGGPG